MAPRIILVAFGLHFIFNVVSLVVYRNRMNADAEYQTWAGSQVNRCVSYIVRAISLITSHKFLRILYSKLFGFKFFSLRLSSLDELF